MVNIDFTKFTKIDSNGSEKETSLGVTIVSNYYNIYCYSPYGHSIQNLTKNYNKEKVLDTLSNELAEGDYDLIIDDIRENKGLILNGNFIELSFKD